MSVKDSCTFLFISHINNYKNIIFNALFVFKMGNNKYSSTAEFTAMIRAWHFLHDEKPLIFEDPVAIDLLCPELHEQCINSENSAPGGSGSTAVVIGRSRLAEDKLEEAICSGTNQYVLLGAGSDSFALRRPDLADKIRIYEIDQLPTQEWKRERLKAHGYELPPSLEFISADLQHETVLDVLDRSSSFRRDQRVFFSWLGVVMYLTPDAISGTLRSLSEALVPGSEIVFDYRVQTEFIDSDEVDFVLAGDKYTAELGEPKHSFFNPHTFPDEIKASGFEMVENISPDQLAQQYLTGRTDITRPTTHHWYAHLKL